MNILLIGSGGREHALAKGLKQSASCDFLLKRENKPTILFENKDYSRNANPEEVKKFIRDINERNQHGIFLSQNSGITTKHNFQIEFHKF